MQIMRKDARKWKKTWHTNFEKSKNVSIKCTKNGLWNVRKGKWR
jgi:hypothetical protein